MYIHTYGRSRGRASGVAGSIDIYPSPSYYHCTLPVVTVVKVVVEKRETVTTVTRICR